MNNSATYTNIGNVGDALGVVTAGIAQLGEAFAAAGREFVRATPTLQRYRDTTLESEWRHRYSRRPPGSWRTKRLAKKRRKALDAALLPLD